ncbi:MAG: KH domain-containing protein [Spirochaetes bacterium]|nr:KH domain-containing protein [Spirochaetota bacterium]
MEEKLFIEYLAKQIVDDPAQVAVNVVEGERNTVLELTVGENDVGKIIGRRGRIAHAIRTLLSATATKTGRRVVLEIIDKK